MDEVVQEVSNEPQIEVQNEEVLVTENASENSNLDLETIIEEKNDTETVKEEDSTSSEDSQKVDLSGLQFDGVDVQFVISDDMRELATSKGFEPESIIKEFFDNENKLTESTLGKLTEAYGKVFVDSQLKLFNMELAQLSQSHKTKVASEEEATKAAMDSAYGIVGGEEGWASLEEFMQDQPEDVVEGFNAAMDSGNKFIQQMALKGIMGMMKPEQSQEEALELLDGSTATQSGQLAACSRAEFIEAMRSGEYKNNPQEWDARRRAGMAIGI